MFSKAKKILASELMYARDFSEDEANAFLDTVLDEVGAARRLGALDLAHDLATRSPRSPRDARADLRFSGQDDRCAGRGGVRPPQTKPRVVSPTGAGAWVIVAAAGESRRMGLPEGESKQFLLLAGEPIISHSVRRLSAIDEVAGIVVVLHPSHVVRFAELPVVAERASRC